MPRIQKKKKQIEQCTKIFIYRDLNTDTKGTEPINVRYTDIQVRSLLPRNLQQKRCA